ncbi:hypothetical protein ABZ260_49960, partial [Streptosporangium sp. NPDC006013]|uniref:hypothetical protein n=1 Tax=Streptosporangium sp. NPDC006013 TaxID=3155596 RepID=UPI0033A472DB
MDEPQNRFRDGILGSTESVGYWGSDSIEPFLGVPLCADDGIDDDTRIGQPLDHLELVQLEQEP